MANKSLTLNVGVGGDKLGVIEINDAVLGLIRREEHVNYGGEESPVVTITADGTQTLVAAPGANKRIVVTKLAIAFARAVDGDVDLVVAFDSGKTIFSHPGATGRDYFTEGGGSSIGYGPLNKALQVTPTGLAVAGGSIRFIVTHFIEDFS
jgi:hypothetical protein